MHHQDMADSDLLELYILHKITTFAAKLLLSVSTNFKSFCTYSCTRVSKQKEHSLKTAYF